MSLTTSLLIILGVLFLLTAIVSLALVFLRYVQRQREVEARQHFPNAATILSGANFFGQESLGVGQMRGNGTLVLTESELYFELWLPRKTFHIPYTSVQGVSLASSHLGKTAFRPLLKVQFTNAEGQPDSMAWLVPDVEKVKRQLEDLIPQNSQ